MKNLTNISFILFATGLTLKFFHFPLNAYIMMAGILMLLIVNSIAAFKKENQDAALKNFAAASWMTCILFTLKFWPHFNYLFLLGLILSGFALKNNIKDYSFQGLRAVAISAFLAISFYALPTDVRYKMINIKWNKEIAYDYRSWDKYSWFLYQNGHKSEALNASNKALDLAHKNNAYEHIGLITQHNKSIQTNEWNSYKK